MSQLAHSPRGPVTVTLPSDGLSLGVHSDRGDRDPPGLVMGKPSRCLPSSASAPVHQDSKSRQPVSSQRLAQANPLTSCSMKSLAHWLEPWSGWDRTEPTRTPAGAGQSGGDGVDLGVRGSQEAFSTVKNRAEIALVTPAPLLDRH